MGRKKAPIFLAHVIVGVGDLKKEFGIVLVLRPDLRPETEAKAHRLTADGLPPHSMSRERCSPQGEHALVGDSLQSRSGVLRFRMIARLRH